MTPNYSSSTPIPRQPRDSTWPTGSSSASGALYSFDQGFPFSPPPGIPGGSSDDHDVKPLNQDASYYSLPAPLPPQIAFCSSPSSSAPPSPSLSSSEGPTDHIPRPLNAFMIFRSDFLKRDVIPSSIERRQQTLSRVAGEVWNLLPPEEKKMWHERAAEASRLHSLRYPNYKFTPARRGSGRKNNKERNCEGASDDQDRIRKLRETYLNMCGPAVPPVRRRRGKQRGLPPETDVDSSATGSSVVSTTRSRSIESSVSEPGEPPLPALFPQPTYPLYNSLQAHAYYAEEDYKQAFGEPKMKFEYPEMVAACSYASNNDAGFYAINASFAIDSSQNRQQASVPLGDYSGLHFPTYGPTTYSAEPHFPTLGTRGSEGALYPTDIISQAENSNSM